MWPFGKKKEPPTTVGDVQAYQKQFYGLPTHHDIQFLNPNGNVFHADRRLKRLRFDLGDKVAVGPTWYAEICRRVHRRYRGEASDLSEVKIWDSVKNEWAHGNTQA